MFDSEKSMIIEQKRKSLINAIRAMSLFLLSLLLAIFAAFAWFGGSDEGISVAEMNLAVTGQDLSVSQNNDEEEAPILNGRVYLPSATKYNDSTISTSDLEKAVTFKSYKVTSSRSGYVKVTATKGSGSSNLHYMMDSTKTGWATKIKSGTDVDTSVKYFQFSQSQSDPNVYEAMVYVALYGDYVDGGQPKTSFTIGKEGENDVLYGTISFDFAFSSTSPNS